MLFSRGRNWWHFLTKVTVLRISSGTPQLILPSEGLLHSTQLFLWPLPAPSTVADSSELVGAMKTKFLSYATSRCARWPIVPVSLFFLYSFDLHFLAPNYLARTTVILCNGLATTLLQRFQRFPSYLPHMAPLLRFLGKRWVTAIRERQSHEVFSLISLHIFCVIGAHR